MNYSELEQRVRAVGVVPILQPRSVDFCLAAIDALVEGGASSIEIVLRSPDALPALAEGKRRHPGLLFAAGTILEPEQYARAVEAGADFCISPGLDPVMMDVANKGPIRIVPGVQTASEVIAARRMGATLLKFYPSEPAGGTAVLADFGSIFSDVSFMPSGKIGMASLAAYGRLSNVASVGGSWMYMEAGAPLPWPEMTARMQASLAAMTAT
ncbi:MAG: bifunctional 4-hydroxy-2-oxoglutarate aldolase/2-dehydro-3-deoxy-phosphogluconate aldolase [Bauldia sp.]|nr:bifunctional 4-hydroxy-2-oxoglutarate aldolase/2-dehydro-3-deoxy-phosphogluconate aldolase [Bauldia sp.]